MIYYVEDDVNIRGLALYALEQSGLPARGFSSAGEFYAACRQQVPSLILLDIMLPEEDGISILKRLRSQPETRDIPIMMITAKGSEFDVVTGLDSGADDYLTKPFGMMELVSRANALLRRSQRRDDQQREKDSPAIELANVRISPKHRSVKVSGKEISLTRKEFDLLYLLMQNKELVFTREHLLTSIWGWDFGGNTRTVDVHIQTLRKKLREASALIETVHGVGYRVRDQLVEKADPSHEPPEFREQADPSHEPAAHESSESLHVPPINPSHRQSNNPPREQPL
ncbi:MAG: response regulator transcription factor [Coriobacteriales bacterium]|jgi:two-component system alkaline phosphatase synthesis response regulator PhoP|nr:response regulator transcription factor [Coriobacteriales bacterium]